MMRVALGLLAILPLLGLLGCTVQSGATPAGQAVLLETEPPNAQDIAAYKINFAAGMGGGGEATVVGRVRSGATEPWDTDQATFLLASVDLGHDHDAGDSECAFCQAKERESIVMVRVVDKSGSVIPTDARRLLGLEEDQVVVAKGQGVMDNGAILFDASRVFIRNQ